MRNLLLLAIGIISPFLANASADFKKIEKCAFALSAIPKLKAIDEFSVLRNSEKSGSAKAPGTILVFTSSGAIEVQVPKEDKPHLRVEFNPPGFKFLYHLHLDFTDSGEMELGWLSAEGANSANTLPTELTFEQAKEALGKAASTEAKAMMPWKNQEKLLDLALRDSGKTGRGINYKLVLAHIDSINSRLEDLAACDQISDPALKGAVALKRTRLNQILKKLKAY